jgi:hypothetical protein
MLQTVTHCEFRIIIVIFVHCAQRRIPTKRQVRQGCFVFATSLNTFAVYFVIDIKYAQKGVLCIKF